MGAFLPTKCGLVTDYLKNKILGRPLPGDDIPTVDDAYFKSPDQLCSGAKQGSVNEWYFYTSMPNCNFVTDDGFYSVFTAEDILSNDNAHVGFLRILFYYQGLPPKGKKTNWIMHEFSVNPAIIPSSKPDAMNQAKTFVVCNLINTEGDKSSPYPNYTPKRKRMQEERDKDEEKYNRKRARFAPPILENRGGVPPPILQNTISGAPDHFSLNLKAVLSNCSAVTLNLGSNTDERVHKIVALCKVCMFQKVIEVSLFSRRRTIETCKNCRQMYRVDVIAPGRPFYLEDSLAGKAVPIMYLKTWNLRSFVLKLTDSEWNVSLPGNMSVKIKLEDCHRMEFRSENVLGVNSFFYTYNGGNEFTISDMRITFNQFNEGLGASA